LREVSSWSRAARSSGSYPVLPNKALELAGHRSACRGLQRPAAGHGGMGEPRRLTGGRPMGRGTFTGRQLNAWSVRRRRASFMSKSKSEFFPCPACGFLVFSEPPGSYDVCGICGWEDDHVQLRYPFSPVGANQESLFDAQRRTLRDHPLSIRHRNGHTRDETWRPLTNAEAISASGPTSGQAYFEGAAGESPSYYWRASKPT
jgi:hypothetical protein